MTDSTSVMDIVRLILDLSDGLKNFRSDIDKYMWWVAEFTFFKRLYIKKYSHLNIFYYLLHIIRAIRVAITNFNLLFWNIHCLPLLWYIPLSTFKWHVNLTSTQKFQRSSFVVSKPMMEVVTAQSCN